MSARISLAIAACVVFLSVQPSAQAPGTRDYLSELTGARASALPDGRIVVSIDAAQGDLRGLLTLTLAGDGDGATGTWVFTANYLEELRPDGTPIAASDHVGHDHDDPSTPALHREYAQFKHDGALTGTVTSVTFLRADDGSIAGIRNAELVVSAGSRTFKSASGSGRVGPWPALPGALTLYLSF